MLPTFLIIGAPQCGTTSMYHYLRQHPDVFMSPVKEPRYYSADACTRAEYERLFDGITTQRAAGEVSTEYLHLAPPDRVLADLPGVRLVVSLRHPAERAYSHYLHTVRHGFESRPARDALVRGSSAVETSFYASALQRWLDRFPRERMHVILFDDFAAQPAQTMQTLFAFLGIDPTFTPDTTRKHNTAAAPRKLSQWIWKGVHAARRVLPSPLLNHGIGSRIVRATYRGADPFPHELRPRLLDFYRDDVDATARLIGRDLAHWLV